MGNRYRINETKTPHYDVMKRNIFLWRTFSVCNSKSVVVASDELQWCSTRWFDKKKTLFSDAEYIHKPEEETDKRSVFNSQPSLQCTSNEYLPIPRIIFLNKCYGWYWVLKEKKKYIFAIISSYRFMQWFN